MIQHQVRTDHRLRLPREIHHRKNDGKSDQAKGPEPETAVVMDNGTLWHRLPLRRPQRNVTMRTGLRSHCNQTITCFAPSMCHCSLPQGFPVRHTRPIRARCEFGYRITNPGTGATINSTHNRMNIVFIPVKIARQPSWRGKASACVPDVIFATPATTRPPWRGRDAALLSRQHHHVVI